MARKAKCPLTLEGEPNKLAANISVGMLKEQALGYPTDPFVLSIPTFDGGVVRIGAR